MVELTDIEQKIFDKVMKAKPTSNPVVLKKMIKYEKDTVYAICPICSYKNILGDEADTCEHFDKIDDKYFYFEFLLQIE